jgi:hypothetical protein
VGCGKIRRELKQIWREVERYGRKLKDMAGNQKDMAGNQRYGGKLKDMAKSDTVYRTRTSSPAHRRSISINKSKVDDIDTVAML